MFFSYVGFCACLYGESMVLLFIHAVKYISTKFELRIRTRQVKSGHDVLTYCCLEHWNNLLLLIGYVCVSNLSVLWILTVSAVCTYAMWHFASINKQAQLWSDVDKTVRQHISVLWFTFCILCTVSEHCVFVSILPFLPRYAMLAWYVLPSCVRMSVSLLKPELYLND